ncbi:MAG: hypothetical protein M3179_05470 [Actinomycetota bacterium]|nr:hypothetical protein [Actinomycetota bacterium]
MGFAASLDDPDDNDTITADEFRTTAVADLFDLALVPKNDAVVATLTVDSELLGGTPDVTIRQAADIVDPDGDPPPAFAIETPTSNPYPPSATSGTSRPRTLSKDSSAWPPSLTGSKPLDGIDILSRITIDGTATLGAGYAFETSVGFEFAAQPREGSNAPIGSCTDSENNDGDADTDAADADCAGVKTLEERVFLDVGSGSGGTPGPMELKATASAKACADVEASIGMLAVNITAPPWPSARTRSTAARVVRVFLGRSSSATSSRAEALRSLASMVVVDRASSSSSRSPVPEMVMALAPTSPTRITSTPAMATCGTSPPSAAPAQHAVSIRDRKLSPWSMATQW